MATVDSALAAVDWVAFSVGGSSAVLFSSSSSRLQVLNGLPKAPLVTMDLDASTLPEVPLTATVSDDGRTVLVASGHSVYLVAPDGTTQLLLSAGEIVSLMMLRNGTDAAASERSTGSIHLLQNITSSPVERVLASGLAGLGKLYPSWDSRTIFVARPGTRAVSSIDLASGEIQSFDSNAPPVTLFPLRNRDTFLISAKPQQAGWIFYHDGNTPRAAFVPAAQAETTGHAVLGLDPVQWSEHLLSGAEAGRLPNDRYLG